MIHCLESFYFNKKNYKVYNALFTRNYIDRVVKPILLKVRDELIAEKVGRGVCTDWFKLNFDFTGLCDEASSRIKEYLLEVNNKMKNPLIIDANLVHGELRHTTKIASENWLYEHTWLEVTISTMGYIPSVSSLPTPLFSTIYIDATCGQFNKVFNNTIPAYYISDKPEKWLYPDRSNPIWRRSILRTINEKIRFSITCYADKTKHEVGIIEFFMYEVWARISDAIYYTRKWIKEKRD